MTGVVLSEEGWQGVVVDLAHSTGWLANHTRRTVGRGGKWTTSTSVVGWPDLTLAHPAAGLIVFAELKTDRGAISPFQRTVLRQLDRCAPTFIWRPADFDDHVRPILTRTVRPDGPAAAPRRATELLERTP